MAWFTNTAEAASLISVDNSQITDQNLAWASLAVEAFINREVEDMPSINERDLRRIKKSIAWQALFLNDQEDYSYITLLDSTNTDGQQFNMVKAAGGGVDIAAQLLHPMVIRYLRNLSWKRKPFADSRTAALRTRLQNFNTETSDDYHRWEEL